MTYTGITPHSLPRYTPGDVSDAWDSLPLTEFRELFLNARFSVPRNELLDILGVSTTEEVRDILFPVDDSPAGEALDEHGLAVRESVLAAGYSSRLIADYLNISVEEVALYDDTETAITVNLPPRPRLRFPNLHHVPEYLFVDSTSTMPTSSLPGEVRGTIKRLARDVETADKRVNATYGRGIMALWRSRTMDNSVIADAHEAARALVDYAHELGETFGTSPEQISVFLGKSGNRYWVRRLGEVVENPFD